MASTESSSTALDERALREAVDCTATLSLAKSVLTNHALSKATVHEFESSIQNIESRAADKQLYLAVVGEFSVGKSSFINALLRDNFLMSDVLQGTTTAPTVIRFEPVNWWNRMLSHIGIMPPRTFSIHFKDGTIESRRYRNAEELKEALHGSANDEARSAYIDKIVVGHTSASLADGLVIIDTPGLNSDNERHAEVVESVINHLADGFVILTSAEAVLPMSLLEFMSNHLADSIARSVIVVTKMDLIQAAERDRHLAYIRNRLSRQFRLRAPLVLEASPKFVLDTSPSAAAAEWSDSFRESEKKLMSFLRQQRDEILAERTAKLLSRLLSALHSELSTLDAHCRDNQTALEQNRPSDEQAFFQMKRADYLNHFAIQVSSVFTDTEKWLEGLKKEVKNSVLSNARNCTGFGSLRSELLQSRPEKVDSKVGTETAAHLQLVDHALNRLVSKLDVGFKSEYLAEYPQVFHDTSPEQIASFGGAKIPTITAPMSAHLAHVESALKEASSSCLGIGFLVDLFKNTKQVNAKVHTAAETAVEALFRTLGSRLRDAVKIIAEHYSQAFEQCMLKTAKEYGARVKVVTATVDEQLREVARSRQQIQFDIWRIRSRESEIMDARKRFSGTA